MSEQKKRPIGIYIENCEDVILSNNTGIGDMDFIVAKNSKNTKVTGNEHLIHNQATNSPIKQWYEKPLGILSLGLIITILGAGITFYLGWH